MDIRDRQTDGQDYYGNTTLCINVHHMVKMLLRMCESCLAEQSECC